MQSAIYLLTVLIAALIGFLVATSLQQALPDSSWLYDYQALVAGLMAIAAAAVTVAAMTWIDVRQQARHEDLMRLSLRPDLLKLRRAFSPAAGKIREASATVRELPGPGAMIIKADFDNANETLGKAYSNLRGAHQGLRGVTELMDDRGMTMMRDFEDSIQEAKKAGSAVEAALGEIEKAEKVGRRRDLTALNSAIDSCRLQMSISAAAGIALADYAEHLVREYSRDRN